MNTLESYEINNPSGTVDECAKFVIDEVSVPFTLHNIIKIGQEYTLGFWVKSEASARLNVASSSMSVSTEWERHVITFVARNINLNFLFETVGTYYIYHPKLEIGNKDTDWTEAPEDVDQDISDAQGSADEANQNASTNKENIERVEATIAMLEDSIEMVVQGLNTGSKMTQTEEGWVFAMGENKEELIKLSGLLDELSGSYDSTKSIVDELTQKVDANDKIASYVKIDEDGEQPVIQLGTAVNGELGEFMLRITNTSIQFIKDNDLNNPIAWISNQELHIRQAVIEEELTVGGFVLKQHGTRNNVGWIWKGVTS